MDGKDTEYPHIYLPIRTRASNLGSNKCRCIFAFLPVCCIEPRQSIVSDTPLQVLAGSTRLRSYLAPLSPCACETFSALEEHKPGKLMWSVGTAATQITIEPRLARIDVTSCITLHTVVSGTTYCLRTPRARRQPVYRSNLYPSAFAHSSNVDHLVSLKKDIVPTHRYIRYVRVDETL